jgi:EAL domain-containing protein (putative c-di-GMP-specific phosphodiesterase class I)
MSMQTPEGQGESIPLAAPSLPPVQPVGHLRHPALSGMPMSTLADGRVVGAFDHTHLASVFQPIIGAQDGRTAGHHGYLRVAASHGDALVPQQLFARAADDAALVKLDRMTRALHALNYFHQAGPTHQLFLIVEQRLLSTVANEHGLVFESILAELGVKPERVVISLPNSALAHAALLLRSILSYRNRGYGVMTHLSGVADPGLSRLFLAEPHHVQIDLPAPEGEAAARRLVKTLSRAGFTTVARKVESEAQAKFVRDLGFDLIHGFYAGMPQTAVALEGVPAPGQREGSAN